MKKFLCSIIVLALLIPTAAFAAERTIDLETMTIEELQQLSKEIDSAIAKASATVIDGYSEMADYDEYARNADLHLDESIFFNGTIIQVVEGVESNIYRIAVEGRSDDMFYVTYTLADGEARHLEDDHVTVMGSFVGLISYESTLGGSITIPGIIADKIVDEVTGTSEYAATRDDPAPIGFTARYDGSSYYNETVTDITVTQVIRGDAAWKMVKGFNRYNDEPESNQEYIIAYVNTSAVQSLDGKAASIDSYDFSFISSSGVEYEYASVAGITPELKDLYEGAEYEGLVIGMVEIGDAPLLVYLDYADNPLWFDLSNSLPIVLDENVVLESLEKGDTGSEVLQLQTKLVELGYLTGTPDGQFGAKTEAAVALYQTDMGLESTGIADDQTLRMILTGQK